MEFINKFLRDLRYRDIPLFVAGLKGRPRAAAKKAVSAFGRVHGFVAARPKIVLAAGIALLLTGVIGLCMPDLNGVEDGVRIRVKVGGKYAGYRYLSPRSDGFVFSRDLPGHVIGAIITAEDDGFYGHNGVDFAGMMDAAKYDIEHKTLKQGGSTITQQVVKNVYLTGKKSFTRKAVEVVTALRLEKKLTKRQILDYYINLIEFGNGIYGINQASHYYFGKSPYKLTAREAAMLAILMPRPVIRGRLLEESDKDEFQKKRVSNLLRRMKANGYLKEDGA